jgi:hypothetical protein
MQLVIDSCIRVLQGTTINKRGWRIPSLIYNVDCRFFFTFFCFVISRICSMTQFCFVLSWRLWQRTKKYTHIQQTVEFPRELMMHFFLLKNCLLHSVFYAYINKREKSTCCVKIIFERDHLGKLWVLFLEKKNTTRLHTNHIQLVEIEVFYFVLVNTLIAQYDFQIFQDGNHNSDKCRDDSTLTLDKILSIKLISVWSKQSENRMCVICRRTQGERSVTYTRPVFSQYTDPFWSTWG